MRHHSLLLNRFSPFSFAVLAPEGSGGPGAGTGGDGPGAGAGGPGAGGGGAAGGGAGGNGWGDGLDASMQQLVQTKGWKSPAEVLKGYAELEGFAGRAVAIPGDDAKPEDVDKFYNKLGRPEAPEKYDFSNFKVPDGLPWNPKVQDGMRGVLHKAGVSQKSAAVLMDGYAALQNEEWKAREANAADFATKGKAALEKDWGNDFQANLDLANRAVKEVFGNDLEDAKGIQLADGTYLLDHPNLAKVFKRLGSAISEDGDLVGARGDGVSGANGPINTPQQAEAEIARIRGDAAKDPEHPYVNRKHPEYQKMQAHMTRLYGIKAGNQQANND